MPHEFNNVMSNAIFFEKQFYYNPVIERVKLGYPFDENDSQRMGMDSGPNIYSTVNMFTLPAIYFH